MIAAALAFLAAARAAAGLVLLAPEPGEAPARASPGTRVLRLLAAAGGRLRGRGPRGRARRRARRPRGPHRGRRAGRPGSACAS